MIVYLLMKRPMKQLINFIQQVILEVILFAFNICVLSLAIMDQVGNQDAENRDRIGKTIVYINLAISILSVVLMGAKFLVLASEIYKEWRKNRAGKRKAKKVVEIEQTRGMGGGRRLQEDDGKISRPTSLSETGGIVEHHGIERGGLGNNTTNMNMTMNYLMSLEPEDSSILDQSLSPMYRRKVMFHDGKNKEEVSMSGFALELSMVNNTASRIEEITHDTQQQWNRKKSKNERLEFENKMNNRSAEIPSKKKIEVD